jgi:hypothetical protein
MDAGRKAGDSEHTAVAVGFGALNFVRAALRRLGPSKKLDKDCE